MVARSIEMPAISELDTGWSVSYVHCTFCIALKLAPTTLQFKRSDIKIEYNKHKIDSPMRRTNKSFIFVLESKKINYPGLLSLSISFHQSL